jgi:micrococcal nuclease
VRCRCLDAFDAGLAPTYGVRGLAPPLPSSSSRNLALNYGVSTPLPTVPLASPDMNTGANQLAGAYTSSTDAFRLHGSDLSGQHGKERWVAGQTLALNFRSSVTLRVMKLAIQRCWRWTSTAPEWRWAAGLIGAILAFSILIVVVRGGTEKQSWGDGGSAPPKMDPPATLRPMATGEAALVGVRAFVVRVIDGDTVEIDRVFFGQSVVRYAGINAPETMTPGLFAACYGREASNRNKELVEGKTVFLEKDVSEQDQSGHLFRYVYLEDGQMVNELLVVEGFAQASSSQPDVRYQEQLSTAQQLARSARRGLWGQACQPAATPIPPTVIPQQPTSVPQPVPTPAPSSRAAPLGNCSSAYPTVCIPPPPPDLDCRQIPFRRFQVLAPDPHRLDPNSDGIGCEMG